MFLKTSLAQHSEYYRGRQQQIAAAYCDFDYASLPLIAILRSASVSVYVRSVRYRLHWQYRRWYETSLETTLKPLSQVRSDDYENEISFKIHDSCATAAFAAISSDHDSASPLFSIIVVICVCLCLCTCGS